MFLPGLGIKNVLEIHMLRLPCFLAHDRRNLGSSESMKSSRCCVKMVEVSDAWVRVESCDRIAIRGAKDVGK
jgi:hypothetical protein